MLCALILILFRFITPHKIFWYNSLKVCIVQFYNFTMQTFVTVHGIVYIMLRNFALCISQIIQDSTRQEIICYDANFCHSSQNSWEKCSESLHCTVLELYNANICRSSLKSLTCCSESLHCFSVGSLIWRGIGLVQLYDANICLSLGKGLIKFPGSLHCTILKLYNTDKT